VAGTGPELGAALAENESRRASGICPWSF